MGQQSGLHRLGHSDINPGSNSEGIESAARIFQYDIPDDEIDFPKPECVPNFQAQGNQQFRISPEFASLNQFLIHHFGVGILLVSQNQLPVIRKTVFDGHQLNQSGVRFIRCHGHKMNLF